MSEFELLELLYRAAESEFGIAIETDDPKTLRQKLYPIRRKEGLQQKLGLSIVENEVWIRRKEL